MVSMVHNATYTQHNSEIKQLLSAAAAAAAAVAYVLKPFSTKTCRALNSDLSSILTGALCSDQSDNRLGATNLQLFAKRPIRKRKSGEKS